jgi:hypothetical protein
MEIIRPEYSRPYSVAMLDDVEMSRIVKSAGENETGRKRVVAQTAQNRVNTLRGTCTALLPAPSLAAVPYEWTLPVLGSMGMSVILK